MESSHRAPGFDHSLQLQLLPPISHGSFMLIWEIAEIVKPVQRYFLNDFSPNGAISIKIEFLLMVNFCQLMAETITWFARKSLAFWDKFLAFWVKPQKFPEGKASIASQFY